MDAQLIASILIFAFGVYLSASSYRRVKEGDFQALIAMLAWIYGIAYFILLVRLF